MEKTLKVDVVNAEESLFSGNAEFVIRPGLVRIRKSAQDEEEIFVAGGVLEIQPFHVIVLADVAIRSKDLDEAKAKEAMEKAKAAAKTAASEIELAKVEAEIGMLAEQLRILQRIKH